jgi:hypothetical protein
MVYEYRNQTKLGEFGCIQHDIYPFIGASPDGINIDPTSPIYGRMVEIKNIVNREITGRPKEEYWIQTQIQMEVCDLDDCDFVETRFKEFESEEHYNTATNIANDEKGIILWFQSAPTLSQQGHVVQPIQLYEYAPIGATVAEYEIWETEMFSKHERLRSIWVRTIYWYLDQYSCVLVRRNRLWFQEAVPVLEKLWNTVEEERKSGYDHRAPAKRKTAATSDESQCSTGSIKIVKLNTSIMSEESQEVTSTNMASLITQQQQHQQQLQSNKYRQNPNKGPSDVLIKCFKIDDLEIIESKAN